MRQADARSYGHAPQPEALAAVDYPVGVIVFVVTLVGGYAGKWSWTGYGGNDTLWDWLRLLLLPVMLATAPIWLTKGRSGTVGTGRSPSQSL